MASGLEHLLAEGIVTEVLGRLKSGKEADVYAVRFGGNVVAAKVYKERSHRNFKNNAAYKEGRSVRNSRSQRAMDRKTSFGQASAEAAWKTAEADALYRLHAAEVRVPTPVLFLDGVLLMELVLGADGEVAPRIIDTTLTAGQARDAYHDMLRQLVRILACDLIHGDLSPYNVLWGARGPTIIDFPQIISASHSSNSQAFFLRDARNILGHFASIDRSLEARSGDANEIWRAYLSRELTPEFLPVGRTRPVAVHQYNRPPQPTVAVHADGGAPRSPVAVHQGAHASRGPVAATHEARPQNSGKSQNGPRHPQHNGPRARGPTLDRSHAPSNGAAGAAGAGRRPAPPQGSQQAQRRAPGPTRGNAPARAAGSPRRSAPTPEVIVRIARGPRPQPTHPNPADERPPAPAADGEDRSSGAPPRRHRPRG